MSQRAVGDYGEFSRVKRPFLGRFIRAVSNFVTCVTNSQRAVGDYGEFSRVAKINERSDYNFSPPKAPSWAHFGAV